MHGSKILDNQPIPCASTDPAVSPAKQHQAILALAAPAAPAHDVSIRAAWRSDFLLAPVMALHGPAWRPSPSPLRPEEKPEPAPEPPTSATEATWGSVDTSLQREGGHSDTVGV